LLGKMSSSQTRPPESLPKYIKEGVPKQSTDTLRKLRSWITSLIEYRENLSEEDITADEGEQIKEVDDSGETTTVIKKVPCGKDACSTCPHGPYRYEVHREGGKLVWDYKGAVER